MNFKSVNGHLLVELHLEWFTHRLSDPRLLGVLDLIAAGASEVLLSTS